MLVEIATFAVLSVALLWAMMEQAGGALGWIWPLSAIGFAGLGYFFLNRRCTAPRIDRLTVVLLSGLAAVPLLQILPLPVLIVAVFSPARAELLRPAEALLGESKWTATLSVAPEMSEPYAVLGLGMALVFLIVRELSLRFRDHVHTWAPAWPLLAAGLFQGTLGIFQTYMEGGEGYARGTYSSRDYYAWFLELVLPFAVLYPLAILSRERPPQERPARPALKVCGLLVIAAVLLVSIIDSLSPMAFWATLTGLFLSGAIGLGFRRYLEPPVVIHAWTKWLPCGLIAAAALLGYLYLPVDALKKEFSELASSEAQPAGRIVQVWQDSKRLAGAYPVFGAGLGAYHSASLRYRTAAAGSATESAHSDYLQVLGETGFIGFLLGLALGLRVLYSAVYGIVYAGLPDDRMLSVACFASLTVALFLGFLNSNLSVPANALVLAWIAGMASTRLTVPVRRMRKLELLPPAASAAMPAQYTYFQK